MDKTKKRPYTPPRATALVPENDCTRSGERLYSFGEGSTLPEASPGVCSEKHPCLPEEPRAFASPRFRLIPIDLYQRDLAVYVGEWRGMISLLSDQMKKSEVRELEGALPRGTERGRFLLLRSGLAVIWIRGGRSAEETALTLLHETTHCAFSLLKEIGISFCPESEEAYTYLIEYLTGEAWRELGLSPASASLPSVTPA